MVLIFCMSATPGEESSDMSLSVGWFLYRIFVPGFRSWTASRQLMFAENVDFFVRKCAHAAEYAVLAVFVRTVLRSRKEPSDEKKAALSGLAFAFLYACTDEFHQLFVEGRSGRFSDVMIDTGGAAAGLLLTALVRRCGKKRRNRRNDRPSER